MSSTRKRVLFFSPYAGIWPHALPESYLAKCLDSGVFDVSRVVCDGTFNHHCTVMSAASVGIERSAEDKAAVCARCQANSRIVRDSYAGDTYVISKFLTPEDIALADAAAAGLTEEKIQDFEFGGMPVGRIAAYETLIKFKKTALSFRGVEFDYLATYVRSSMLSLIAFRRIYAQVQPDVLLVYSPQYGMNGVCARYCEMNGTPVYFIEGSSNINERYQALRIWNWTEFGLTNPALKYWDRIDQYTLTADDKQRALRHTDCLLNARSFSVYSEPALNKSGMRDRFGVPPGVPLMLAAMSSYDEAFSAYVIGRFPYRKYASDVFADQLEWIRHTVEFFRAHPDLWLIIRIHPRTFPTRRNSVMAAEQQLLAKLLGELPPNVRVNYPEDKVSIYDLYREIDALVTGWSATGVEAMTFGVPVVTYDSNMPSYPPSIHYTGRSREQYEHNLLKALAAGRSQKTIDDAYRWMTFSMSLGVVRHPPMIRYDDRVTGNRLLHLIVRVAEKVLPGVIKRFEASRSLRSPREIKRVTKLLTSGARSLYDV